MAPTPPPRATPLPGQVEPGWEDGAAPGGTAPGGNWGDVLGPLAGMLPGGMPVGPTPAPAPPDAAGRGGEDEYYIGQVVYDELGWPHTVLGVYTDTGTPILDRWSVAEVEAQQGIGGGGAAAPSWRPGEFDLMLQDFQESIRQFNMTLQEQQKTRSLTAARDALSAYLDASANADARRLRAMQETRALAPMVAPPGMQHVPGLGPSGPIAHMAGQMGAPFEPFPMTTVPVSPARLAEPAPISPEVQAAIEGLRGLGMA